MICFFHLFQIKAPNLFPECENHCKTLSIKVNLYITFYLKIDEQSEIVNQETNRHLCTFVNYQQDDWSEKLVIAEFAANNNESVSTKPFLFFATRGLHPYISFDKVGLYNASTCKRILNQKTFDILGNM